MQTSKFLVQVTVRMCATPVNSFAALISSCFLFHGTVTYFIITVKFPQEILPFLWHVYLDFVPSRFWFLTIGGENPRFKTAYFIVLNIYNFYTT